jgi:cell wall-associated NlpC family hydrolase
MTPCKDCLPLANSPVATVLDASLLPPVRLDVAARAYLGVPFLHQGRDPRVGIDCVGLLVQSAKDCGWESLLAHDFTGYARNPAHGELERRLRDALGRPPACCPRPGDVVSIDFKGQTRHVAIVGVLPDGRLSLIHTYNAPAKVIEHGLDEKWRKRITGIYRLEAV